MCLMLLPQRREAVRVSHGPEGGGFRGFWSSRGQQAQPQDTREVNKERERERNERRRKRREKEDFLIVGERGMNLH
jgi:hypothetical protein